jgi:hypothetical protein
MAPRRFAHELLDSDVVASFSSEGSLGLHDITIAWRGRVENPQICAIEPRDSRNPQAEVWDGEAGDRDGISGRQPVLQELPATEAMWDCIVRRGVRIS